MSASAGSFDTGSGEAIVEHGWEKTTSASRPARDDRPISRSAGRGELHEPRLDRQRVGAIRARLDRRPSRLRRHSFGTASSRFLVPNEHIQQEAGQRQDRNSRENAAQFSYPAHLLRRAWSATFAAWSRDVSAKLWSNPESTPIAASQDRGFREFYLKGSISGAPRRARVEGRRGHERRDGPRGLRLHDHRSLTTSIPTFRRTSRLPTAVTDREQALFVQDQIRRGPWTVNAGLRWDHYRLVVDDNAVQPRLAVAWSWPEADLVLRASYDRAFQTPAIENLLLASTDEFERARRGDVARLPVPTSRGNFFEAGLSKATVRPGSNRRQPLSIAR